MYPRGIIYSCNHDTDHIRLIVLLFNLLDEELKEDDKINGNFKNRKVNFNFLIIEYKSDSYLGNNLQIFIKIIN